MESGDFRGIIEKNSLSSRVGRGYGLAQSFLSGAHNVTMVTIFQTIQPSTLSLGIWLILKKWSVSVRAQD